MKYQYPHNNPDQHLSKRTTDLSVSQSKVSNADEVDKSGEPDRGADGAKHNGSTTKEGQNRKDNGGYSSCSIFRRYVRKSLEGNEKKFR